METGIDESLVSCIQVSMRVNVGVIVSVGVGVSVEVGVSVGISVGVSVIVGGTGEGGTGVNVGPKS